MACLALLIIFLHLILFLLHLKLLFDGSLGLFGLLRLLLAGFRLRLFRSFGFLLDLDLLHLLLLCLDLDLSLLLDILYWLLLHLLY